MVSNTAELVESNFDSVPLKRVPVFLTILLSVITMGVYIPYWFLSRRKVLNKLYSNERISLVTPFLLLVLYGLIAITIIPVNVYISGYILLYYHYIDTIITYIGVTITLYMTFQVRNIFIHNFEDTSVNSILTFFFHIFYLQHKINKV